MEKTIKETIHAKGIDINIYTMDFQNEYVSLTDIARYRSADPRITIHNWLRGRDIVEFLGLWEVLHNPDFKHIDFDAFKEYAGTNAFVFSIKKWNAELGAVGLLTKSGRYGGGIYAHMDIALDSAVAEVISRLVSNPKFSNLMRGKINMEVDTSTLDLEIANHEKQLRLLYHNKDSILSDIDSLDYEDKHYKRRKTDLENRLYKTYDKIDEKES